MLLTRLSQGDKKAFDELYEKYSHPLYLNLIKLTKSTEAAEELLQEIFVRIWNKRETLDIHTGLGGYLFKISQHLVYDFFRKARLDKKLHSRITETAAEEYTHIEETLLSKENRTLLYRAIDSLPPVRQQVFRMCKLEGRSYDEVAAQLGISISTVNDHIVKATRHIRRFFPIIILIINSLHH